VKVHEKIPPLNAAGPAQRASPALSFFSNSVRNPPNLGPWAK